MNLNFDPVFQPPLPNSQGGLTPPQRKPAPFIGETKKEFPWRPGRRSITPCGDGTQRGQGGKGREGRDRGGGKKRVRGKISRKGKTPSAAAKDNNFTPPPYWGPPCASATTKQAKLTTRCFSGKGITNEAKTTIYRTLAKERAVDDYFTGQQ